MNLDFFKVGMSGGGMMWVIIVLSIVAVAVAAERFVALWKFTDRARTLADTVTRCLSRGALAEGRTACERSKSPLADIFLVGFERRGRSSEQGLEGAVDRARQRVNLELRSRLWIIGTIGAVAAFVGLLGTVIGIMQAFKAITERGGAGITVVGQGLSEALITTAAGILVAVVAVIIFNYFNQRLAAIAIEVRLLIDEFLEVLRGMEEVPDGARKGS